MHCLAVGVKGKNGMSFDCFLMWNSVEVVLDANLRDLEDFKGV